MKIIRTVREMRELIKATRKAGKTTGFVPTMGALHEGHLSLVRESRRRCDFSVISIFVNRIQFNDPADFSSYPKTFESDCNEAEANGVDCVFAPEESELYKNQKTFVTMQTLPDFLCGASRPGHFTGVFTVVSKLFNIISPDVAFFGQKDIQQARCIEKMCEDLDFPVSIAIMPIIREREGLAMSSRNVRLSSDERERALVLFRSLSRVEELLVNGETRKETLRSEAINLLDGARARIDYVELVHYDTLMPADTIEKNGKYIFALAAYFGETRLIDNMIITPEGCLYR